MSWLHCSVACVLIHTKPKLGLGYKGLPKIMSFTWLVNPKELLLGLRSHPLSEFRFYHQVGFHVTLVSKNFRKPEDRLNCQKHATICPYFGQGVSHPKVLHSLKLTVRTCQEATTLPTIHVTPGLFFRRNFTKFHHPSASGTRKAWLSLHRLCLEHMQKEQQVRELWSISGYSLLVGQNIPKKQWFIYCNRWLTLW